MSFKGNLTGNIGNEPELRYTSKGDAMLGLSIAATHSTKNRDTGQWADVGEPLWVKSTFFGRDAEHLAGFLHKGDKVTVEGTLVSKPWTTQAGEKRDSLELHFPRFLGVVPRRQPNTHHQPPQPATAANNSVSGYGTAPAGGTAEDPWGTQGTVQNPPF